MTHGIELFDADGTQHMRVTTHLTRLVHQRSVAAGASGSEYVVLPSDKCYAFSVYVGSAAQSGQYDVLPHVVTLDTSTGLLSWSTWSSGGVVTGPSIIMVVAYG